MNVMNILSQSWSEYFAQHLIVKVSKGDLNFTLMLFLPDVTPPAVQNCPASFVNRSNSLQQAITWTPPTFTDNVGVVSIQSNRDPGFIMDTYTSLTVRYTALDAAGNVVYCIFNITLEGSNTLLLKLNMLNKRKRSLRTGNNEEKPRKDCFLLFSKLFQCM